MRKCKVVIGHEDLLIWNQKGEHSVISNFRGGKQRQLRDAIPIHAIHCEEEATEHHTEIYAVWHGGAHGAGAVVNDIHKSRLLILLFAPNTMRGSWKNKGD